jgi:hypothetical protein
MGALILIDLIACFASVLCMPLGIGAAAVLHILPRESRIVLAVYAPTIEKTTAISAKN